MPEEQLTIGELAHRTGVAASALRYWEEFGLLPPPARVSGQRRYPPSAVELTLTSERPPRWRPCRGTAGREADVLAAWLRAHPEIEVIGWYRAWVNSSASGNAVAKRCIRWPPALPVTADGLRARPADWSSLVATQ